MQSVIWIRRDVFSLCSCVTWNVKELGVKSSKVLLFIIKFNWEVMGEQEMEKAYTIVHLLSSCRLAKQDI